MKSVFRAPVGSTMRSKKKGIGGEAAWVLQKDGTFVVSGSRTSGAVSDTKI